MVYCLADSMAYLMVHLKVEQKVDMLVVQKEHQTVALMAGLTVSYSGSMMVDPMDKHSALNWVVQMEDY